MAIDETPVEELEEELAELASRIAAATARVLEILAELHRREAWPGQGFTTLAHWLSWRTGLDPGAAREHVRVAVALDALPVAKASFARGELSYSKIRAITRVAGPATDALLVDTARLSTAAQLEKIVRGVRRVDTLNAAEAERTEDRRSCVAHFDDDGMFVVRARLSAEEGALFLRALEAAEKDTAGDRAAALALVADRALAAGGTHRRGGDRTQVVVHVDADVLADATADGQSQLADGPGVSAETSRRMACDASLVMMSGGQQLGRKTRVFSAALRRALELRDGGTCRFPACTNRIVDAHHIVHWADGGPTTLDNACLLCGRHHTLVHEGGHRVDTSAGRLRFLRPDGREVPLAPPLAAHAPLRPAGDALALGPVNYAPDPNYEWAVQDIVVARGEQELP